MCPKSYHDLMILYDSFEATTEFRCLLFLITIAAYENTKLIKYHEIYEAKPFSALQLSFIPSLKFQFSQNIMIIKS